MSPEMAAWLISQGYIGDRGGLGISWSKRSGYDNTELVFYPLESFNGDVKCDAIIGHHQSGSNPRMIIGTCETLADVQRIHEAIRLTNGYPGPDDKEIAHGQVVASGTVAPVKHLMGDGGTAIALKQ